MGKLETLRFDNTYARLGDSYSSPVLPEPARDPRLVAFNPDAAALIGLDASEAGRPELLSVFSGGEPLPGMQPVAMVYSGHQFGVRVPRLGDGRAILLGEALGDGGARQDLHLKGAGMTPYSRQGDGRAVLRSCIREYLCGEAMHGLGIPTTRSLCITASGTEPVFREKPEPRALLTRMAPSHARFGSFEYFFFRHHHEPDKQRELLRRLADYVIDGHFPEVSKAHPGPSPERYGAWLGEIARRTARLIAAWQAVGWTHGVMNTDNLSILGLTLDYGPFGFMDEFDFNHIPNHSDEGGRYAFSQQPGIGLWNLNVLAQSILPLTEVPLALQALESYEPAFHAELGRLMRAKLGLREERPEDATLVQALLTRMQETRADYTNTFRSLSRVVRAMDRDAPGSPEGLGQEWLDRYLGRLRAEGVSFENAQERALSMSRANPKYILRTHLAQRAIEKAESGDFNEIERLRLLLKAPFDEQPENEADAGLPPAWSKELVISCSS